MVPDCHGVIAGSGITKSKKFLARLKNWILRVRFHFLNNKKISKIISSLDILVSVSYSEGFPTVGGMSSEVPVIATNVGDTELLLGGLGFTIASGNHLDLSKKMVLLKEMSQTMIEERQDLRKE